MSEILIPRKKILEGTVFPDNSIESTLRDLENEGFEPVFMPQLIDARIEAPKDGDIFKNWYTAPSIRATGRTNQGSPVVVYAHIPNFLSDPDNVEEVKKNLVNGAGIIPQSEIQRLVDLDESTNEYGDRLVWVVDYEFSKSSSLNSISLEEAFEHPEVVPFIGGEKRTKKYLTKHKEVYGEKIEFWRHDDLSKASLGRLLFLGDDFLDGGNNLDFSARFVGVRAQSAPTQTTPTTKQLNKIINEYVPPILHKELKTRIENLTEK